MLEKHPNYARQVELEKKYSDASLVASQKMVINALEQGRFSDVAQGRILFAKAFEVSNEAMAKMINTTPKGNSTDNYVYKILSTLDADLVTMLGLRLMLNACTQQVNQRSVQGIMTKIGSAIESECLLANSDKINKQYTDKTVEYLDSRHTKDVKHRYRTFKTGAGKLGIDWDTWTSEFKGKVGAKIAGVIFDSTGLFTTMEIPVLRGNIHVLCPTPELEQHFKDVVDSAQALVKFPPMLLPPKDWKGQYNGGYVTDYYKRRAIMCSFKNNKLPVESSLWLKKGLSSPQATTLRNAMNKAQSVPYTVNTEVLTVLRKALAKGTGLMGLPNTAPTEPPKFPMKDGWDKVNASETDLEIFGEWKRRMAQWYTDDTQRKGRQIGLQNSSKYLNEFKDEPELYFPTYVDWRGRVYFRGVIQPQSNDAVKGCLNFAKGKRLGADGLFWLKVHVANCAGYDKHTPEIKAKWTEDNLQLIMEFVDNPLDIDPPEPDTAFTLLQAGLELKQALSMSNPQDFVSHVPVAMDATCSGLQHLSALTRDEQGAEYTNLTEALSDQKADIYTRVATTASTSYKDFVDDLVVLDYWKDKDITRTMAKKPVMTYVYGSTLLSTIDGLELDSHDMGYEPIFDEQGKPIYSTRALVTPIAKALRKGVETTVPKADEFMRYLKKRIGVKGNSSIDWVTPVGMPVCHWISKQTIKQMTIRALGITTVRYACWDTDSYDKNKARAGIVPNFVHSLDASHLCMVLDAFDGQILPIHDSLATHACDVGNMHTVIREQFYNLYSQYDFKKDFLEPNNLAFDDLPSTGKFDINRVKNSTFMFC